MSKTLDDAARNAFGLPRGAVPPVALDSASLAANRDEMTAMAPDARLEDALLALVEECERESDDAAPLASLKRLIDNVREMPRSDARVRCMNTIVQTLGKPQRLATLLDALRRSYEREGTREHQLAAVSREGKMHAIYGWCGQTSIVWSSADPAPGTSRPYVEDIEAKLKYPQPLWWLSIHIWQPNPNAEGFASGKPVEQGLRLEPPHSHPFDFASVVSVGKMHQCIYEVGGDDCRGDVSGRYDGIALERVDGVWPPHQIRQTVSLRTAEHRVPLAPGESYFMPIHRVHDVDVDASSAATHPAVTLFLATESVVVPNAFIAPAMADYHEANPDLVAGATPLSPDAWQAKLAAVSAYLRDESVGLSLADIVRHDSSYAFFHA